MWQQDKSKQRPKIRTGFIALLMGLSLTLPAVSLLSSNNTPSVTAYAKKTNSNADSSSNNDKTTDDKNKKDNTKDDKNKSKDQSQGSSPTKNIDNNHLTGATSSGGSNSDPYVNLVTKISSSDSSQYKKIKDGHAIGGNAWGVLAGKSYLFGMATQSSYTTNYITLFSNYGKDSMNTAAAQAGGFGLSLISAGLDHSSSDGMDGSIMATFGRMFGGILLYLGYVLDEGVGWMFKWISNIVNLINPVTWAQNVPQGSIFSGIAGFVNTLYQAISKLGLIGAAIGLGVGIFMAVMGWKKTAGGGLTQAGGRIFARIFIILVLPLVLGSFFATVSKQIANQFSSSDSPAGDYAVYSGFTNFQNWVQHSRLEIPNGHLDALTNSDDPKDTGVISRTDALAINSDGAGINGASAIYQNKNGHNYSSEFNNKNNGGASTSALSMIGNWMTDAQYLPSDWSSYTKARLAATKEGSNAMKNASNVISKNDVFFTNGTLHADSKFGTLYTDVPQASWNQNMATSTGKLGISAPGGLSTIGMYNYLSTNFSASDMTWTAGPKLTNAFTAPVHKSVGLVGRGMRAFSNYLLSLALIWAPAILGIFVTFGLITSLFKGILDIIIHLFGAGMGSLKQGMKLILAVFAVLIELEGGAIFYVVASQLLISLVQGFDSMLSGRGVTGAIQFMTTHGAKVGSAQYTNGMMQASAINATAYTTGELLLAILLFWITIKLIKYRGTIAKTFYETIENTFKSIFGQADAALGGSAHGYQNAGLSDQQAPSRGGAIAASHDGRDGANGADGAGQNGADGKAMSGGKPGADGSQGTHLGAIGGAKAAMQAKEAKTGKPLNFARTAGAVGGYAAQRLGQKGLGALGKAGIPGAGKASDAWASHQNGKLESTPGNLNQTDQQALQNMQRDPYGQSGVDGAKDMNRDDMSRMIGNADNQADPASAVTQSTQSGASSTTQSSDDTKSAVAAQPQVGSDVASGASASAGQTSGTQSGTTGKPQTGAQQGATSGASRSTKSATNAQPKAGQTQGSRGATNGKSSGVANGKPSGATHKAPQPGTNGAPTKAPTGGSKGATMGQTKSATTGQPTKATTGAPKGATTTQTTKATTGNHVPYQIGGQSGTTNGANAVAHAGQTVAAVASANPGAKGAVNGAATQAATGAAKGVAEAAGQNAGQDAPQHSANVGVQTGTPTRGQLNPGAHGAADNSQPNETTNQAAQGIPDAGAQSAPQGDTNETPTGVPTEAPQGGTNDAATGTPTEGATEAPQGGAVEAANDAAPQAADAGGQNTGTTEAPAGAPMPATPQAANAGVQSAMQQADQAQQAYRNLGPAADKADKQKAYGAVQQASQGLSKARQGAVNYMSRQAVPTEMQNGNFVSRQFGNHQTPTIGQSHKLLTQMGQVYSRANQAHQNGDKSGMQQATRQLAPLYQQAKSMGLNKNAYANPRQLSKSLNTLNSRYQQALNGNMQPQSQPMPKQPMKPSSASGNVKPQSK